MSVAERFVLIDDPYHDPADGPLMQFRLTYDGLLMSSGNETKERKADHKHEIRLRFHSQMKRLWEIVPSLSRNESGRPIVLLGSDSELPATLDPHKIAMSHPRYGSWRFVPLVRSELDLMCGIEILLLRPRKPGGLIEGQGDIDGQLKTLLDALALPDENQRYHERGHQKGECPLYVLLANDKLITKVSVETDQLLEFKGDRVDPNAVRLVVTVNLRPFDTHIGNMSFG